MHAPRKESKLKKKQRKLNENDQVSHHETNSYHERRCGYHLCFDVLENVNRELFQLLGDLDPQMVPVEELETAKNEEGKMKVVSKLNRPVDKWVWNPF